MAEARRLYLIDGSALAYRSHFAFAATSRGGLSTQDGRPTAATYGFTMTLRALLDSEHPELCAVAFDGAREALERTKIYPEYKSTRDKAPDEMVQQLDDIRRVVEAHGIPIVSSPGHEADDVIGTLASQARDAGMKVFIVTGDKDFMQLVDDDIKLWNLRTSTRAPEIIDRDRVREKFGVEPEQIVDLLALMGDSSDNIPGVPRVGQKTASTLLQTYGTLDAALANVDEVKPPSIQKALREHQDQALLSRTLVELQLEVPIDLKATELPAVEPDIDALRALFKEFEFDSLVKALPRTPAGKLDQDYAIVTDPGGFESLLTRLSDTKRVAIAIETSGQDPMRATIVGVAFAWQAGVAEYVPLRHQPPLADGDAVLDRLRAVLESPTVEKVGHDIKRDAHVLRNAGVELRGIEFDVMLASYCLRPGVGNHDLESLSLQYFDYVKTPAKEILGTGKKQRTFDQIDVPTVGHYACENADLTWRLRERMDSELVELGVRSVFREIEMPLTSVLLDMEHEGIRIDTEHLAAMSADLSHRIRGIEDRIYERAGEPFNLNSPAQIGEVLFGKLEVHRAANVKPKKTRTGQFKTDAAVLEKLARFHEVPELILDYRLLSKLRSTYVDSLPTLVHPRTGRIHTTFNQAVAATGRLSSDNPNLQNIPIRTAEGREVRRAFIARDTGWVLLSADYSQIELRILAHAAQDQPLIDAFRKGDDIHTRTASVVHGLLPGMVTPEMRNQAKVINYGLMYGMGPSRLANETGMTPVEARNFIQTYFRAFPSVKQYLDETLLHARENREVRTLFGRYRPLPDIDSTTVPLRVAAENMAVNTPIQGTAADIIKRAMIAVHSELQARGFRARLLLQVHDELVLDVPDDELTEIEVLLRDAMGNAADLAVPLEVAMGHGRTWLEAH